MKKVLVLIFALFLGLSSLASESDDALKFFNSFVSASNTYDAGLLDMYSDNAKIIRQVIKPNGQLANAYFTGADYKKQMKLSAKLAKISNYKNYYSDVKVSKVSNGYKIDALRRPSNETYKLKASLVVQPKQNGKWIIVEEMMQTKVQTFLKYAK